MTQTRRIIHEPKCFVVHDFANPIERDAVPLNRVGRKHGKTAEWWRVGCSVIFVAFVENRKQKVKGTLNSLKNLLSSLYMIHDSPFMNFSLQITNQAKFMTNLA